MEGRQHHALRYDVPYENLEHPDGTVNVREVWFYEDSYLLVAVQNEKPVDTTVESTSEGPPGAIRSRPIDPDWWTRRRSVGCVPGPLREWLELCVVHQGSCRRTSFSAMNLQPSEGLRLSIVPKALQLPRWSQEALLH